MFPYSLVDCQSNNNANNMYNSTTHIQISLSSEHLFCIEYGFLLKSVANASLKNLTSPKHRFMRSLAKPSPAQPLSPPPHAPPSPRHTNGTVSTRLRSLALEQLELRGISHFQVLTQIASSFRFPITAPLLQ